MAIELLQQAEPHFDCVPGQAGMPFELPGMLAERGDRAAVVALAPRLADRARAAQAPPKSSGWREARGGLLAHEGGRASAARA
ncbi:MAG: hypothetical protein JNL12_20425 [Planctomycetes bacterium]|nr:hypothetical protein [Planctomycetota bacterium]